MTTTLFYYAFHVLGFVALLLYVLLVCGNYGFSRIKAVALIAATYLSMYGWMLLLKLVITGSGGQNAIRAYVFLPAFTALFAVALGMDRKKALDMTAIAPCIVQGISHFGCLFPGCCYSWLRLSWGIYNPVVGTKLFPVQIAESVTALLIGLWLLLRRRRQGYVSDGLDMPRMMLLFGLTRFGWEFLRDNEKLFWGISELALWALAMGIFGFVWLIIGTHNRKKRTVCP